MSASSSTFLLDSLSYPFKRDGAFLLAGGTLFFSLVNLLLSFPFLGTVALIIGGLASAYLAAYFQRIIQSSAQGEESLPAWPDVTRLREDLLEPALQFAGTFVLCLGPGVLWRVFAPAEMKPCGYLLLGLGGVYIPMGLLAVAMFDDLKALNPLLVIPSIVRTPLAYGGICAAVAAVVAASLLVELLSKVVRIPILTSVLFGFIALYFQVVTMRILGLFYYIQQERLGWF